MKCRREEVLKHFLESKALVEKTTLSEEQLQKVNFSKKTSDPLVESLKVLIFSYCQEDSDLKIIQNINKEIKSSISQ